MRGIEHNRIQPYGDNSVKKDFKSLNSYIYTLCAKTFSGVVQYPVFRRNFVQWPLSFNPSTRAEREWIYQEGVAQRLREIGNEIDGTSIEAVEFHRRTGSVIEMQRLHGYTSLFELLQNSDAVKDWETIGKSLRAYGKWVGILYENGVVPECNHIGNVMLGDEDPSKIKLIDFEMYSGPLSNKDPNEFKRSHKMLDQASVDPTISIALDIGLLSGLKVQTKQKEFYLDNFLSGVKETYSVDMDLLTTLLSDKRVKGLARVRAIFYDSTHIKERRTAGSSLAYFKNDYDQLVSFVINQHAKDTSSGINIFDSEQQVSPKME